LPSLDPRITPWRPDLAASSLQVIVDAPRYVEPDRRSVAVSIAPLRRAPNDAAPIDTEALFGEDVDVYDEQGGWAWAQLAWDDYVGYLPISALGPAITATHRVSAVRTHAYTDANIKRPPLRALSLGARVAVVDVRREFAVTHDGSHIYARHLAPLAERAPDFVAVAERFLEAPYLWGGRTSEGLDCSGLVQGALAAAGIKCPRDSDMMEAWLGEPIAFDGGLRNLARGDFVFWRGHVGVMRDAATLLHANGWHMKVVSEPLAEAASRIQDKGGGAITSIRRLRR